MAIELTKETYKPFDEKMSKTAAVLQEALNSVRAGRANPKVLDQIQVEYYGTPTPLNQVANIQVPEARMIVITPWDASLLKEIERSIQMSDLGINPNSDGKCIRLTFPPLTEERRKDLVKQVQKYGEEAKVAVRNVRRECLDLVKGYLKKKEISEDALKDAEQQIQKLTDRHIDEIEKIIGAKEKDLLEI